MLSDMAVTQLAYAYRMLWGTYQQPVVGTMAVDILIIQVFAAPSEYFRRATVITS